MVDIALTMGWIPAGAPGRRPGRVATGWYDHRWHIVMRIIIYLDCREISVVYLVNTTCSLDAH